MFLLHHPLTKKGRGGGVVSLFLFLFPPPPPPQKKTTQKKQKKNKYFEHGFPDLAVKNVKVKRGKTEIVVEKIGSVPVPIDLVVTYSDGEAEKIHKSTSHWKSGVKAIIITHKTKKG